MDIKKSIGEYFYHAMGLSENTKYEIQQIEAQDLLCLNRLDLVVKYLFLQNEIINKNEKTQLFADMYRAHLKAFNDGKVSEPGNNDKNCYEDYVNVFVELYNRIKENGFDSKISIIPVGQDGIIIDGGHRVAIAMQLLKNVTIAKFDTVESFNYNYKFFQERGLRTDYLDCIVLNYCKLKKKSIYVACIWPVANRLHKDSIIENCMRELQCGIVYKKKVKWGYTGLKNFQILAYEHQEWVGSPDNQYKGIDGKVQQCYANSDMIFYILESDDVENVVRIKERVRKIFDIGKHSIHITDNYEESLSLLRVILNNNSINFINSYKPYCNVKLMNLLAGVKMQEDKILKPEYTLALFGRIDASIIDYSEDFLCKSVEFDYIMDYQNFFWFDNKKFLTPQSAQRVDSDNFNLYEGLGSKLFSANIAKDTIERIFLIVKYRFKKLIIFFLKRINLYSKVVEICKGRKTR